jgi:urate oxidase
MQVRLTHNSYGKSVVRLTKVVRHGQVHELFEINADIQLEGDFEAAYTDGDNRKVIATDSMKNTVYVLAKETTFAAIEPFAMTLARHFVNQYPQVQRATVELTQSAWQRIAVDGRPHAHAFQSAGPHLRFVRAVLARNEPMRLIGGVRNLLVLKTTDSEWRDFVNDRYRTLPDTRDRIIATRVDADWQFNTTETDFDAAYGEIGSAILTTFATRHSLGVQQTLLDMGEAALAACSAIDSIHFELPNMHRIPMNLEPFGLKFENDIFVATDEPHGLIKGTVERKKG